MPKWFQEHFYSSQEISIRIYYSNQYVTPTFLVWAYGSKENSRWEHVVHKGEPRKQELETLCRGHVVRGRGDRARKGT